MNPELWTVDDVGEYLEEHNFQEYRKLFCKNGIDGIRLLCLTENDMKEEPLKIVRLGDRRRLWFLINDLQEDKRLFDQRMRNEYAKYINIDQTSLQSEWSSPMSAGNSTDSSYNAASNLKVKKRKFVMAFLYIFISHFFAGYSVTYAQEHLPDKQKYPPLPDIFLDNLPQIPWAYRVTEYSIILLILIGIITLSLHKHRFRIIQRLVVIAGTIYFLRSLCVMSTAMSMPQTNYDCQSLDFNSGWDRFEYTLKIYLAIGMKTNGIKTCGDYIFSGHTVIIVLLILSINEYTHSSMTYLHKLNWIIGMFGIFFILLGHGHYTLDIVLAFMISAALFHAHHIFANNVSLMTKDTFRIKMCFPVFYYFEHDMDGVIPYEFQWPVSGYHVIEQLQLKLKCSLCNFYSAGLKERE